MTDVEYFSPETLDEAAALLMASESQAPPIADGTDLIAEVREGQQAVTLILDLKRVPELNRLEYDERIGLRIGAAVPITAILEFPPVRRLYPMLADESTPFFPDGVSNRATLGGNLSPALPSLEMAPPLICLRASAAIFGPHGWSEVAVEALFPAARRMVLQPGEFLVDLRFPAPPPRSSGAYLRARLRERMDSAAAGVGAFLAMEQDLLTCCGARLTLGGIAPSPIRALEAERFLSGKRLENQAVREAAALAAGSAGSVARVADDRLELVKDLARRAIAKSLERVQMDAAT
jgi:carbon-monoxide dehydrogenase medium subunit